MSRFFEMTKSVFRFFFNFYYFVVDVFDEGLQMGNGRIQNVRCLYVQWMQWSLAYSRYVDGLQIKNN